MPDSNSGDWIQADLFFKCLNWKLAHIHWQVLCHNRLVSFSALIRKETEQQTCSPCRVHLCLKFESQHSLECGSFPDWDDAPSPEKHCALPSHPEARPLVTSHCFPAPHSMAAENTQTHTFAEFTVSQLTPPKSFRKKLTLPCMYNTCTIFPLQMFVFLCHLLKDTTSGFDNSMCPASFLPWVKLIPHTARKTFCVDTSLA